jgi:murein DD-endopeptidase MepM/ murein hydrolase activator NlpD
MRSFILLALVCCAHLPLTAQNFQFPKEYYLYPIRPGQRGFLAGAMGELRGNHFHGGIDLKTDGQIGLPVLAAADGYVSRMKVTSLGYGNTLYINHPNGQTTLYAHLNEFAGIIGTYALRSQYELKTNVLDIPINAGVLPVKKGDIIAYSGNTGSSTGPHLHFEIRETTSDTPLDVLLFGFKEVTDNYAPVITALGVNPLSATTRINGVFQPLLQNVTRTGSWYTCAPIHAYGMIGFTFKGHDIADVVNNHYGVNYAKVEVNGTVIYDKQLKGVAFEHNRYKHIITDYELFLRTGTHLQKLYIPDGDRLNIYPDRSLKGKFFVEEGEKYDVKITFKDSYQNTSVLNFTVYGDKSMLSTTHLAYLPAEGQYQIHENTMLFVSRNSLQDNTAKCYLQGEIIPIQASYIANNKAVFLYDLRAGLPDSIVTYYETIYPKIKFAIPSERSFTYYQGDSLKIHFPNEALFDTLYLQTHTDARSLTVNTLNVPLFKHIEITFTPDVPLTSRSGMCHIGKNGKRTFISGEKSEGTIKFSTKELGQFIVVEDNLPPSVQPIKTSSNRLSFRISDDFSGIESFTAYLDGEFIPLRYEHKQKVIWTETFTRQPLRGNFELIVKDKAGNQTVWQKKLF